MKSLLTSHHCNQIVGVKPSRHLIAGLSYTFNVAATIVSNDPSVRASPPDDSTITCLPARGQTPRYHHSIYRRAENTDQIVFCPAASACDRRPAASASRPYQYCIGSQPGGSVSIPVCRFAGRGGIDAVLTPDRPAGPVEQYRRRIETLLGPADAMSAALV